MTIRVSLVEWTRNQQCVADNSKALDSRELYFQRAHAEGCKSRKIEEGGAYRERSGGEQRESLKSVGDLKLFQLL